MQSSASQALYRDVLAADRGFVFGRKALHDLAGVWAAKSESGHGATMGRAPGQFLSMTIDRGATDRAKRLTLARCCLIGVGKGRCEPHPSS
jgi:hypothetical protein